MASKKCCVYICKKQLNNVNIYKTSFKMYIKWIKNLILSKNINIKLLLLTFPVNICDDSLTKSLSKILQLLRKVNMKNTYSD